MSGNEHELADALREIANLREELAETNQGVVALYAELDDKAEELRQVSDLKSRFLSYMSHEFRTPLVSIQSMARLLLERYDGPLSEEQERQVSFIQSCSVEMSGMVDDLLDLAKVEAGRITISPDWFELIDLFAALRGMFKPIATTSTVEVVFEEPVGVPPLFSDNQKVAQILRNFISNALKFTERGTVTISARAESDNHVRLSVADTGPGIAENDVPNLFVEFSQVRSLRTPAWRGTGLGLSVCKRFAELLGGWVEVQSRLGEGSVFSVILPVNGKEHAEVSK